MQLIKLCSAKLLTFGDGAKITALRPFNAIITLLAGVAPGLVDGQIAPTTPTGFIALTGSAKNIQMAQTSGTPNVCVSAGNVVTIIDKCLSLIL